MQNLTKQTALYGCIYVDAFFLNSSEDNLSYDHASYVLSANVSILSLHRC